AADETHLADDGLPFGNAVLLTKIDADGTRKRPARIIDDPSGPVRDIRIQGESEERLVARHLLILSERTRLPLLEFRVLSAQAVVLRVDREDPENVREGVARRGNRRTDNLVDRTGCAFDDLAHALEDVSLSAAEEEKAKSEDRADNERS